MTPKLHISLEGLAGIDRLIDRAAVIVANAKRTPKTKRKPSLARTA